MYVCIYTFFYRASGNLDRIGKERERKRELLAGFRLRLYRLANLFRHGVSITCNNISRWIGKIFHRVKDPFFFFSIISPVIVRRIKIQRSILPFPSFSVHLSSSLDRKGKKEKKEKNSSSRRSSRGGIGTFHPSNGN